MIIIDKKKMKVTIVKHPRLYVLVSVASFIIGFSLVLMTTRVWLETDMTTRMYFDAALGLCLMYWAYKSLSKVERFIVKAFTKGKR